MDNRLNPVRYNRPPMHLDTNYWAKRRLSTKLEVTHSIRSDVCMVAKKKEENVPPTHYTVYPTNPSDSTKAAKIDSFLKNLYEAPNENGDLRFVQDSPDIHKHETKLYVLARDVNNDDEKKKKREFLETKVTGKTWISEALSDGHVIGWSHLALDPDAKEVKNYPGIKGMIDDLNTRRMLRKKEALFTRSLTWKKQQLSPVDLNMDSQYP
ncbi:hypothetical protein K458DRAFT_425570 [Lentithecium fluviatile CBS 122367]|uniref:Uncharacterized protein n=1 Tax=Lentithecium fluviatile CBS 122367 TaxID=1168545 RepID=A0A6G1JN33_9PLEO|nr:hypothetical protein K458DRAFT_425570 [Lentithecium fluviatile CBS 122367]